MVIREMLSPIEIEQVPHIHLPENPITIIKHRELESGEHLELLIPEQIINKRVAEIALAIKCDYEALLPNVVFIPIETGGGRFLKLLQREIPDIITKERVQPMRIKSYFGAQSTGDLQFLPPYLDLKKISDEHALIIEDIYDTGLTLRGAIEKVQQGKPASISIAILLDKQGVPGRISVPEIDYCGFKIDNEFVVGASCLDHNERFRDEKSLWVLVGAD